MSCLSKKGADLLKTEEKIIDSAGLKLRVTLFESRSDTAAKAFGKAALFG